MCHTRRHFKKKPMGERQNGVDCFRKSKGEREKIGVGRKGEI